MAICEIVTTVFWCLFVYLAYKTVYSYLFAIPPLPKLDESYWWGTGSSASEDTCIKSFKINVSSEVLKDLEQRLNRARPFTPPLEGIQQQYGMNTNLLKEVVEFWKTNYNWCERETFLNQFPQYTTNIQGLQIHFLHVKPANTSELEVLPLLLLHGWPGSVREFYEVIPLLTAPQKGRNFVFEVIVPSLPGYGFSQATTKRGLGAVELAVLFKNFMERLSFDKYYLQGGDWGAVIVTHMATLYPQHVAGVHVNMTVVNTPLSKIKLLLGQLFPRLIVDRKNEQRIYPLSKLFYFFIVELGYMHIQATKPDTVGVGLNDSPVGLAAYILEKFTCWTNQDWKKRADGGLTLKFSYTKLLDNIMIYWITGSITTSMRLYAESFSRAQMRLKLDRIPTKVPSACAKFGTDPFYQPDTILREKYQNLLLSSNLPTGGHFAALEEPQLFADNISSAVEVFQAYHKRMQKIINQESI